MILPILALGGLGAGIGAIAAGSTGVAAAALTGASIGTTIGGKVYSGQKAADAARTEADLKNQAAIRQYGFDMDLWDLNKQKIIADRNHAYNEILIRKANEGKQADWQDASNLQQYNQQLLIRNLEQSSNEQQFQKSEQIYSGQIGLNQESEITARDAEFRALQDIRTEQAFDQEEAYIDSIINEGKLRARGVTGRSAMKGYQVTAADFGRQVAQLNEAFSGAGRNTQAVLREIATDKASADLAAEAQRMLDPGVLPMPVQPLPTPRATWQLPRALGEFDFGPQPVLGATYSPAAAAGKAWGSAVQSIAGTVSTDIIDNITYEGGKWGWKSSG